MNPAKVNRSTMKNLTDLPNIGKAMAADLELLGIHQPDDLINRDPYQLYEDLCVLTHARQDPCVIDVFISITRVMQGEAPRNWWDYTQERKRSTQTRKHLRQTRS